jgi:hypothetical protein
VDGREVGRELWRGGETREVTGVPLLTDSSKPSRAGEDGVNGWSPPPPYAPASQLRLHVAPASARSKKLPPPCVNCHVQQPSLWCGRRRYAVPHIEKNRVDLGDDGSSHSWICSDELSMRHGESPGEGGGGDGDGGGGGIGRSGGACGGACGDGEGGGEHGDG